MNNVTPAVNFYILSDSDLQNRLLFVCRLVEKAFEQHLPTLIITADNEQLQTLDRLIWSFKPERFIPHDIIDEQLTKPSSILLTDNIDAFNNMNNLKFQPQVVIDLSYDATPLNFPKIMLVANQYQEILANARMKYQSYVNNNVTPKVYKI